MLQFFLFKNILSLRWQWVSNLFIIVVLWLYAIITGVGMSFVIEFIENPRTMYVLQLVGSVLLFVFGYYTYRTKPQLRPSS